MSVAECPRDRLLEIGPESLSDADLVAVLIRSATRGRAAAEIAARVLRLTDGLPGLVSANGSIQRQPGIGPARAATILAAVELRDGLRAVTCRSVVCSTIPRRWPGISGCVTAEPSRMMMGGLFLDARKRLLAERELFRGTLTRTAVEPRTVLKEALWCRASAGILFHTHPSGDPTPSAEDLSFTRQMSAAGKILGIELADHLILGDGGRWVSLRRHGGW